MEDYHQHLPKLSDFSKADQLPCVVRVEESSTALPQLRRGTRLVLLSAQSEDAVLIGEEGTGRKCREIGVSNVKTRFSVLPQDSRHDNLMFHSVEDIVGLQGSDRPEYVRAVQGWNPLIDEGEIFRVRSAVQRTEGRGFCAKWDCLQMGAGGPLAVDLAKCPRREALIDMDITIPFSTSLESRTYTLSEIVEKHRKGEMLMPCRLQIEEEDGDPASEVNRRQRKPGKYTLDLVHKSTVLLGMKTFVPGGSVAGRPFVRIPSTVAQSVLVSQVQQASECRADMAHVMDVLLRERDFSAAELVLDVSAAPPFLAPPQPTRLPPSAGGDDDADDDYDMLTYTEPYQHIPTMHGPRVGPDGRRINVPNVPGTSASLPAGSSLTAHRLPAGRPPSDSQPYAKLQAAPSHLSQAAPPSSPKPTLFAHSSSLDSDRQKKPLAARSRADDYATPATIEELSRRRLSNPGTGDASPRAGRSASSPEDISPYHVHESRSGSGSGTLTIPTRRRTPSRSPSRDVPSPAQSSPLTAAPSPPKPRYGGGGGSGGGEYVDLMASIQARSKQQQPHPASPCAKPRTSAPKARSRSAADPLADAPTDRHDSYDNPAIHPFRAAGSSGGDDAGFPLPPPPLRSLNAVELIDKLRQADLGHYIRIFRAQGIDGEAFCALDEQALRNRIGVVDSKELETFRNLHLL